MSELDWIPGDWGYIKNTGAGTQRPGTSGENIIYVGDESFWGHFNGQAYKTFAGWFEMVRSWNGKAEVKDFRKRPTKGLL